MTPTATGAAFGDYDLDGDLDLFVVNKADYAGENKLVRELRDIAGQRPGTFSRVGLGTFVDPRIEGGRMNDRTTEELIRVTSIDDEEFEIRQHFYRF